MENKKNNISLIIIANLIFVTIFFSQTSIVISDPTLNNSNTTAEGGNLTPLNIYSSQQQTGRWQGFFGSVSGGITLDDGSNNTFYDWGLVEANGEILATRQIITDWSNINCSNQTEIYKEEERLDITNGSIDSINETFTNTAHPTFQVSGLTISDCRATRTYSNGTEDAAFWNVMLNVNSTLTVYTSIMDNDQIGFNESLYDFQLLVPVNWTSGQSTYNIYIELT